MFLGIYHQNEARISAALESSLAPLAEDVKHFILGRRAYPDAWPDLEKVFNRNQFVNAFTG